jgi:hypothetical protein
MDLEKFTRFAPGQLCFAVSLNHLTPGLGQGLAQRNWIVTDDADYSVHGRRIQELARRRNDAKESISKQFSTIWWFIA